MTMLGKQRTRCDRSWEIEAARDGRITGVALEAMALHVEECAECRSLSDYLEGLGKELRAMEPRVDEDVLPRLRLKILERADAEMTGRSLPPPPNRRRLWLPLVAVVAAGMAVAVVVVKSRPAAVPAPSPSLATVTTIDMVDEGHAHWSKTTAGDVEVVDLSDGTLRLHVKHQPGSKRVVVHVPDGEIEDLGTIFHVVVAHGRTQRVGVDEGRVTIRLGHMTPITISSGASWERPEEPTAPAVAPSALPSARPEGSSVAAVPRRAPTSDRSAAPPAAAPSAMSAAREDQAYLQTIRLLREGRDVEAKAAAREYLRLFPDGFRRDEMTRVAQ